jgi:hypothetical protein
MRRASDTKIPLIKHLSRHAAELCLPSTCGAALTAAACCWACAHHLRRWAVGVLIFELCNGLPPFYHEDRLQMYQKIVGGKYTFPATFSKVGRLSGHSAARAYHHVRVGQWPVQAGKLLRHTQCVTASRMIQ